MLIRDTQLALSASEGGIRYASKVGSNELLHKPYPRAIRICYADVGSAIAPGTTMPDDHRPKG